MTPDHQVALEAACRHCLTAAALVALHDRNETRVDGEGGARLAAATTVTGWVAYDTTGTADAAGVQVTLHHAGRAGRVEQIAWRELADVADHGLTPHLADRLHAAYAAYRQAHRSARRYNSEPARRLAAARHAVLTAGLAGTPTQPRHLVALAAPAHRSQTGTPGGHRR